MVGGIIVDHIWGCFRLKDLRELHYGATGNWRKSQDNLNPKYYEAFADYLTEVVLQYKKWGLQFDTLAPFNEPCEGWWYIDRNKAAQEGCNFSARSMDKVGAKRKGFLPIFS